MRRINTYKTLRCAVAVATVCIVALVSPTRAMAQTSSVSAYSPYTMFGIGEIGTQGNAVMRSMGGVGVAWRSSQMVSTLNPAGYSATYRKSFILDISAEGNFLQNRQTKYNDAGSVLGTARNAKNTVNFHEIAIQFPLAKGLGFGLSLTPYSSVGYNMSTDEQSEDIWGNIGRVTYAYMGDGDLTEVKAGVGWEIVRTLSIGVAAKYYWGNIQHNYATSVAGDYVSSGSFVSAVGLDDYAISNFKFQVGAQWSIIANDRRLLTIGATYDYGGSLCPKLKKTVTLGDSYATTAVKEKRTSQMRLPHTVNVGIMYQDVKFSVGADYEYAAWDANNVKMAESMYGGVKVGYTNTNTIKFGFEYTPNRFDVRRYMRRVAYRVGARYGNYYQTFGGKQLDQFAVTAGIGFPVKFLGSTSIDVGVEYGRRGSDASFVGDMGKRIGLIRQDYFKISLGLSLFGEDYWFVRPKID